MVMSHAAVIEDRAAPIMSTSMSFIPVSKNAMTTPGSAAWERPSPMRAFLAQYCEGACNTTGKAQESRAEQYHLRRVGLEYGHTVLPLP